MSGHVAFCLVCYDFSRLISSVIEDENQVL